MRFRCVCGTHSQRGRTRRAQTRALALHARAQHWLSLSGFEYEERVVLTGQGVV